MRLVFKLGGALVVDLHSDFTFGESMQMVEQRYSFSSTRLLLRQCVFMWRATPEGICMKFAKLTLPLRSLLCASQVRRSVGQSVRQPPCEES